MINLDLQTNQLEGILKNPVGIKIGYLIDVDIKYPDNTKQKTKKFPNAAENKFNPQDKFTKCMKNIKPDNCTQDKKICHWADKRNYLIHYRMLKIDVRHGVEFEKFHKIISLKKVSGWKNMLILKRDFYRK